MRGSILGFYGITVVGVCTALPIQSVVNGDRNVILLGALVFLSFGAVLAGCVCCRRRKKGFEEFRNESGTPEAKTEYPIFRALSPESQRNVPLAEVAVNNSNENLIEDDFDNNNGPISPADLENIENNNAGDYIQNLNEVDIEPSVHSINRNLANASGRNVERAQQQPPPELQNVAISSTNHFLESITVHSSEIHSESVVFAKNDKANNDVDSDESPLEKIQVENLNSNPETLPVSNKLQISYIDSVNLEEKVIPARNSFDVESSAVIEIENCNDEKERNYHNVQIELETTTPDESSSIKSGSSDKSGEISSVEEALRALDCAIAGESSLNSGCEDDEDDLTDEDFECNDTNFQNVIRQLLINNGVNSILPDLSEDQININNLISDNVNNLEHIQTEAELLVDSIINESQKIVAERSKPLNNESEYPICNNTIIIENCNIDTNNCFEPSFLPIAKNYDNEKSEFCTNSPLLTPCESIEDFFTFKPLEKTSTPFMQNKFTSQITSESIPNTAAAPGSRKKLLEYNDNVETSPVERNNKANGNACNETIILNTTYASPNTENDTFTFPKTKNNVDNQTFAIDKTFEISPASAEDTNKEFIHPCDPCTSKQAIERDCNVGYPSIVYDREETNSEDMTTITPVNTPIELNYSNETWTRMTKNSNVNVDEDGQETGNENEFESNGWFLHPQVNNMQEHDTFDVEGDDANLELAYKALRKQLAEVLPQPQGISGPPEYSDDEDDAQQNRTFDEYRSPLDDQTPAVPVQNELFINYKRALTPILEESEEETCKTFVMNETKCLDSTSTGCVDTGEAIMGVTKTLMASNDTLFNFEDTLGEREDVFSPRTPTRTELKTNTPTQSCKSNEESSIATLESEKFDSNDSEKSTEQEVLEVPEKRTPPKTIDIQAAFEFASDNDLCSPEQQKTFSEGTNSSTTDRISSDISGTVEHDTTFTTNTNDEKTCVTVIIKDDERISEISEPEWGSTASYGGYEMNSLTDVPSLDYNIINFVEKSDEKDESNNSVGKNTNLNEIMARPIVENTDTEENGQEDSGNSTHASVDDRTSNSDNTFDGGETQKCDDEMKISISSHLMNQEKQSPSNNLQINLDDREKCRNFLLNEIQVSSSQNAHKINEINKQQPEQQQENDNLSDNGDVDSSKENTNPNIKVMFSHLNDFDKISYQKVQTNSQDAVIVDKSKNNTTDLIEKDLINGVHENIFYQPDITIMPNKHQQTITNYSVNDVSSGVQNEQDCLMVADEIIGHLSGEEDPWAEPLHDIRFTGPCSEIISTSFTINEWDSDVDDSHSSEEFMYVRGTPIKEEIPDTKSSPSEEESKNNGEDTFPEYEERVFHTDVWSSHEDKIPVADSAEDEISEGSSSEFEGEFIPSCWDSMATPARSAMKSPDKSSSQHNKKRRNVAFKKQRYHSVYEYPRENASLSPAYSEPYLYRDNELSFYYAPRDSKEEFSDGFTVSSTMRPFHGSQFNALCHTWPTDSDFSWSQVEDLGDIVDDKKLATYSNTDIKWPQNFDSIDLDDDDAKIENNEYYGNYRPDSGVGESAEMLSDRVLLGELCHTKSTLRLPLQLLPTVDSLTEPKSEPKPSEIFPDRLILPTPSCTGSMDSISSSSGSERQVSFSTFGKNNSSSLNENEKRNNIDTTIPNTNVQNELSLKPALILIENGPIEFSFRSDKIKQSDSTDEDSGIESIMKINKESD